MKELTREEISVFEKRIKKLRYTEEYKYFFAEEDCRFDRVFELNSYYLTLSIDDGLPILGLISPSKSRAGSLNGIVPLFRKLLKEYSYISFWRYLDNKKLESIHERIKRKCSFVEEVRQDDIVFIIVGGAERGRRESIKKNR